jgi:hypothetical protein
MESRRLISRQTDLPPRFGRGESRRIQDERKAAFHGRTKAHVSRRVNGEIRAASTESGHAARTEDDPDVIDLAALDPDLTNARSTHPAGIAGPDL